MKEVLTSCTLDCPDTCSILAEVDGDRVTALRGNPDFEFTRGFLCRKSRGFLKRVFSPERILHPLKREGSGWKEISWEEATDLAAGRIGRAVETHGPLSVFYYRDAGSIAGLKLVNDRLFNLLGGATFASGSLCGGAGIAGQTVDFGLRTSHAPNDILNSKLVIIWGRNPAWTNVHLVPLLKEASARGAVLVLVDPVKTATAGLVDLHLAPVPGTDGLLALGLAGCLIEGGYIDRQFLAGCTEGYGGFAELAGHYNLKVISDLTGISNYTIRQLANMYGRTRPAAILGGWGVQRHSNGANTYRLLDALGAITGNIGIRGGGVSHGMDETRWYEKRVQGAEHATLRREIPRPITGRGMLEAAGPQIEVAVVSGGNPVNQCPNTELVREAYERTPFVIVMDMHMTDTAAAADLVLPSTHFLQEEDVVASYWHNYLMPVNPAQGRLGEERTDLETFAAIGKKLGVGDMLTDDPEHYLEALLRPLAGEGITLEAVRRGPLRPRGAVEVPFADGKFATPTGRFRFVVYVSEPAGGSEEYPFHLISSHPHDRNHSQLAGATEAGVPVVRVARGAAEVLNLFDGDAVDVETCRGSLNCTVRLSDGLREDTVLIYEGWWDRLGGSVNRLTGDGLSDMGESATYYDARCRLVKTVTDT
jgi:anaerobic selenocysteine-containing dehydrogenase